MHCPKNNLNLCLKTRLSFYAEIQISDTEPLFGTLMIKINIV